MAVSFKLLGEALIGIFLFLRKNWFCCQTICYMLWTTAFIRSLFTYFMWLVHLFARKCSATLLTWKKAAEPSQKLDNYADQYWSKFDINHTDEISQNFCRWCSPIRMTDLAIWQDITYWREELCNLFHAIKRRVVKQMNETGEFEFWQNDNKKSIYFDPFLWG